MIIMNGEAWEAPSSRYQAILVLYDHDGKTPKRRDFKSVADAVVAFARLETFHAALVAKHRAPPHADVMFLYARTSRREVWELRRANGAGVAAVALGNWVQLRVRAPFESGRGRVLAYVAGCALRAVAWVLVQRHPATARPGEEWPRWVVRVLNYVLEGAWPTFRAAINDGVNVKALPVANEALARMEHRSVDKITSLNFDVGGEPPSLTSVRVSPSLSGYDYVDVDLGLRLRGHAVRLDLDANLGGDDLPDVAGSITRFGLEGAVRVKVGPLQTPLPCASQVRVGFSERPSLRLASNFRLHESVAALPIGLSLKAIDRFIARLAENVLNARLCWPRCATVNLAAALNGPDYAERALGEEPSEAAPIGHLRVEIVRCANLLNNDVGGASDPYVVATLGSVSRKTEKLDDTCDPEWHAPVTFLFDVHESSQRCHLAVFDSEDDHLNAFDDALLGTASFPASDAAGATPAELVLSLDTRAYDGKLKAYHAARAHEPCFVTVRAVLDLDDAARTSELEVGARTFSRAAAFGGALFLLLAYATATSAVAGFAARAAAVLGMYAANAAAATAAAALVFGARL